MVRILLVLVLLMPQLAIAQPEESPLWKLDYDSAQFYWKHDIGKSIGFLANAEKVALGDLGIYDQNYLTILSDLGLAYGETKDFSKAEKYLTRNFTIQREIYAQEDPHVLRSKLNLASVLIGAGQEERGKVILQQVLTQVFNTEDGLLAALGLIRIYESREQYDSAGATVRKMLAQPANNQNSLTRNELLFEEGRILRKQKKYNDAINVFTVLEKNPDEIEGMSMLRMNIRLELALIDADLGRYYEAENSLLGLYREIKVSTEPDEGLLTEVTSGLGYFYEKINVFDKALAYYTESLTRCVSAYGYYSASCMVMQNNIAGVYLRQGKIKESIHLYESFLNDYEKLSRHNSIWLGALNNLASAYRQDERYSDALGKFNEVYKNLEIRNLINDDLAASVMNNMAVTYTMLGSTENAIRFFERALAIKQNLYGSESPVLSDLTGNLAVCYWIAHRKKMAMPLFGRSLAMATHMVRYVFPNLTNAEQVEFYRHQKENFERFNTIAAESGDPKMLVTMFNNQLLLKSLTFFTNQKRTQDIHHGSDGSLKKIATDLQSKGAQLSNFYQMSMRELSALGVSIPKLEHEIDSLEKLARQAGFEEPKIAAPANWSEIRNALKQDEALVEIVRFRKYDALPSHDTLFGKAVKIGFTDSITYAALVTTPRSDEGPTLVILKNGAHLETRNLNYYRNTRKFKIDDTVSYKEYWLPIERQLDGAATVYLTSDGVYHQLNLNAIHDRQGNYLLEKYDLRLLLNASQILKSGMDREVDFTRVVLIGDPDFTRSQNDIVNHRSHRELDRLPGTQTEIKGILKALRLDTVSARVYMGKKANESNLKHVTSPSVLHIATHGFFSTDVTYVNEQVKNEFMFHSGLILSGEHTSDHDNLSETDGIVTASDVMNLSLNNTDLVVLSACDTGLGKIEYSEGVYGLQRSFLQAGAHMLIISLWKVEDETTKDQMVSFYQYLGKGNNCRSSFRSAQLDMLHRSHDPGQWGAFILSSGN